MDANLSLITIFVKAFLVVYDKFFREHLLAKIDINFIGLWRVMLGVRSVTVELKDMEEAREYVETNYGPILRSKLLSRGITKNWSIWDSSNVLLNGKNIKQAHHSILEDGDRLDMISKVAGG